MKIQCPQCNQIQEVRKDDVMGRYFVCRRCHHTFSWEHQVLSDRRKTGGGCEKPNCA